MRKESLREANTRAINRKRLLKESSSDSDEIYVKIVIPDGYYDEYGNPNGELNSMQERCDQISGILEGCGAQVMRYVPSDPEAGIEGDDLSDTGVRIMSVAQLRDALSNNDIGEDEIAVYSHIKDEDEYTDEDWNIVNDPYNDTDINEAFRIYDINSLIYDSDEYVNGLVENKTSKPNLKEEEEEGPILDFDSYDEFKEARYEPIRGSLINLLIDIDDNVGTNNPLYRELEGEITRLDNLVDRIAKKIVRLPNA